MRRERISDRFREISVGVDVSFQRGSPSRIATNESMTPSKRLPGWVRDCRWRCQSRQKGWEAERNSRWHFILFANSMRRRHKDLSVELRHWQSNWDRHGTKARSTETSLNLHGIYMGVIQMSWSPSRRKWSSLSSHTEGPINSRLPQVFVISSHDLYTQW